MTDCLTCLHRAHRCPTPANRAMWDGEIWDCAFHEDGRFADHESPEVQPFSSLLTKRAKVTGNPYIKGMRGEIRLTRG
jgi:hypothetical protein